MLAKILSHIEVFYIENIESSFTYDYTYRNESSCFARRFKAARQDRACLNIDPHRRYTPPGPHLFNDGSPTILLLYSCKAGDVAIVYASCWNFMHYQC